MNEFITNSMELNSIATNSKDDSNVRDSTILVHCLAGIGRTGTFIAAIQILLCKLENMPHKKIAKLIYKSGLTFEKVR